MYAFDARRDALRVRRATVRGAPDGLRARQRLEAALLEVASSGIGLSPQALLVVRRVAPVEPLQPGPTGGTRKLGQAVRSDLERIARRARRPWQDTEVEATDAVLFADEAELVACLVRDWLRGRVADRWWWRSVLGDLSAREWLQRHVLARGELMVPVIAVLAPGSDAAAWLARLDDTAAEAAVAAIERSHAVSLRAPEEDSTARSRRARRERYGLTNIKIDGRSSSGRMALERLVEAVPEVRVPELRPLQRRLAALVLALVRAPSWARTPQLALALGQLERTGPPADGYVPAHPQAIQLKMTGDTPVQDAELPEATGNLRASPPQPEESTPRALWQEEAGPVHAQGGQADRPAAVARTVVEAHAAQPDTSPAAPVPKAEPPKALAVECALRVHTMFGGIFYLLNAALALKLYADFTSPRGPNLRISPWDWLALIGRNWFGREFVHDPVSKLLAGLAGRERRRLRRPRWLEAQIESLLARLALALGDEQSTDIPAFVCRYPAEVALTASGVHVHLSLGSLPIALRIAGLDRDPGWIPAAGRSIAFHFE